MFKAFESFIISYMTTGSSKSYLSYLCSAFKKFSGEACSIFEFLEEYSQASREMYCDYLISLLNAEINNPDSIHNPKTLKNYKSAVSLFSIFLGSDAYPCCGTKVFSPPKKDTAYTDEDLIKNFKFRLETQDRYYANACFPCRLFAKVFAKNRKYNRMIENTICNTIFLIDPHKKKITLNQLDHLIMTANGVEVWHSNNKIDAVYTETFSKGVSTGFSKSTAHALSQLSLDHDKPLVDIVNENINSLSELNKLSRCLLAYKAKSNLTGSKLITEFYALEYSALAINESQLLEDVISIYNHVQLTIMDKKYNSSKNRN